MLLVCAWCEREGRMGLIGETSPFDDPRTTHGICWTHVRTYLKNCDHETELACPLVPVGVGEGLTRQDTESRTGREDRWSQP
ncbi:hypothetical protein DNFV4_04547 [Nitrospira tepida]|uniref:Uncharacterized protein n=1 Tax=Nitrospira tepida TaxID=2973512 RepID=A0AA86N3D6_9BACT|nr:hypothetical protein DNFV4_04547 [Nitrospira tepida]